MALKPQAGPQTRFLSSTANIAGIGGGAGGGKSFSLLMDPLRYLFDYPGFHGVIFRRTFPEINLPGGLWDTSAELYSQFDAIPKKGDYKWLFPHDNTISFHHLQHPTSIYPWQGSQVTYFGFDELTHFLESMFTYLVFSRGRSGCDIDSYTRCSCNPDPDWVKRFFAPWVDTTYPVPAAPGEKRWFIRNDKGVMEWVDKGEPDAISVTFVKANVYDNLIMLAKNPRYIPSLKALPPVERARLLDGDWDVRREGLVYPEFGSCVVDEMGSGSAPSVGGMDFGFSNPFAAVWGYLDHDDTLWVTGCRYVRQCTLPTHIEAIPKGVRYWCDPALPESIVQLRHAGHDAIPCVHLRARGSQGEMKKPILHGIDLVSDRMRTGRLKIVRQACMPLIRELGMYCYDPEKASETPVDADNHACDALRYLVVGLDRHRMSRNVPEPEPAVVAQGEIDDDDERWWR